MEENKEIKVALVDDHQLFRKGMAELINDFAGITVTIDANNGKEFLRQLQEGDAPDIVLLDIRMPVMDGYETAAWLQENLPSAKVLTLSMYDDEAAIIRMLRLGAKGYVLKDAHPAELEEALRELDRKGFYYSELVNHTLLKTLNKPAAPDAGSPADQPISLREAAFLRLVCSELTYKEIADRMCLAPRTIDGYRDALFVKLQVKNRVGLVLYAIRNGYFRI